MNNVNKFDSIKFRTEYPGSTKFVTFLLIF